MQRRCAVDPSISNKLFRQLDHPLSLTPYTYSHAPLLSLSLSQKQHDKAVKERDQYEAERDQLAARNEQLETFFRRLQPVDEATAVAAPALPAAGGVASASKGDAAQAQFMNFQAAAAALGGEW